MTQAPQESIRHRDFVHGVLLTLALHLLCVALPMVVASRFRIAFDPDERDPVILLTVFTALGATPLVQYPYLLVALVWAAHRRNEGLWRGLLAGMFGTIVVVPVAIAIGLALPASVWTALRG